MIKHLCAVALATMSLASISAPAHGQEAPEPSPVSPTARKIKAALAHRVFIDVDAGFQSETYRFSDARADPFFGETASWTADYETESGPTFGVSGGVRIWRNLLASVTYSRFNDTSIAPIEGAIPHPFHFNRTRAIAGEADNLKQQEDVFHIGAVWVVPASRRFDLRVFGGPSVYRLQRDLVEDVVYGDAYPYDTASFERALVERTKRDAWGFNVGADATWMFSRVVGLGVVTRFARATTDLTSPANAGPIEVNLGGLQFGGGLRLRFGGSSTYREPSRPRTQPQEQAPGPVKPEARPQPAAPALPEPSAPTAAKPLAVRDTVRVKRDTGVFVRPGSLQPLRVLTAGTTVKVRELAGEWVMVEFKDPQWGIRVGYVLRADCQWP
jgi:opacity protein-like surface antigen